MSIPPFLLLGTILLTAGGGATEHTSWEAYMKANRYKCPGPFHTLKTPRTVTLGGKAYTHSGYKLQVKQPSAPKIVKIGLVSAIKDVSPGTRSNFKEALAWFKQQNVDWLVVNGDLALEEFDLDDVVVMLGESGLPVLIVLGNSESKGSFARIYRTRGKQFPNLVNGTWVRQVMADGVEFWTVPGYHDRKFVHQGAGCLYKEEDIRDTEKSLPNTSDSPVFLVTHGPPKGSGKHALDWIVDNANVGDPMLNRLIERKKISFGLFGHILEAGGAAVGADMKTPVKPKTPVSVLHVNAGSLSGDPWAMNDGTTSRGMAMLITLANGRAQYEVKRFTPPEED